MSIKKNKTLISLMLGVMLLVGFGTLVAAEGELEVVAPYCDVIVTEPQLGGFYDPVTIAWHLEGNACNPLYYTIQYNTNCLSSSGWKNITTNLDPLVDEMEYEWNNLPASGQYCIRVNMIGTDCAPGCCSVTGYSGIWYLDLAKPEVDLSVGTPQMGECDDGDGTCYVTQNTEISLSCEDNHPDEAWQSGVDYMEYRYSVDDGEFTDWMTYDGSFSFPEDTNHLLEYRCFDKVGKFDSESKAFVVETVAPVLTRTVGEPQVCPEEGDECTKYFNLDTEICVSAVDPEPHPSNNVQITCDWWYGDVEGQLESHHGTFTLNDGECFKYTEDSFHSLECTATDALGNSNTVQWLDIVDAKAPVTTLTYTGPYYESEGSKWIDGVSEVVLSAMDSPPHPVNGVTTYYRYGIVDDEYCDGTAEGETSLEGAWTVYAEPFKMDESCHLIEYYSTDALANVESIKQEFVFVDKTAPTPKITVNGAHNCDSLFGSGQCEEDWDYLGPMETTVTLSCEDQLPHPSGVSGFDYRIIWDGDVSASEWVHVTGDHATIQGFGEECEHTVELRCVDNVEKSSEDSVLIKIQGNSWALNLNTKWNLISIPFNLNVNSIDTVFGEDADKIEGVWSYENGEWKVYTPEGPSDLAEVVPGRGYWVKTTEAVTLTIDGTLIKQGPSLPPSVTVNPGWNLIGHYGLISKPVECSLGSLFGNWNSLFGYDSVNQIFTGVSSPITSTNPGEGYWVSVTDNEDHLYMPTDACAI